VKHIDRIDVLRGVAILSVILFHLLGTVFGKDHPGFHDKILDVAAVPYQWWLLSPLSLGWTGVALFFVISGYVIHRSRLLAKNFTWLDFLKRRFWRIYPAYFIFLVVFSVAKGVPLLSADFLLHLLMLQNLTDQTFFGGINGVFWSVAVECQLYALYPVLISCRRYIPMLPLSGAAATIWLLIAYTFADLPPNNPAIWASPFLLWPAWTIGAVIAEKHIGGSRLFNRRAAWIIVILLLLFASSAIQPLYPLAFNLAAIAWAAVLDSYVFKSAVLGKVETIACTVGAASYSIYLIHQPIMVFVLHSASLNRSTLMLLGGILFTPAIVSLGWLSYSMIEKRFNFASTRVRTH
jgi:peptidoglycan/LPS O-acetylase OafA/YrhL